MQTVVKIKYCLNMAIKCKHTCRHYSLTPPGAMIHASINSSSILKWFLAHYLSSIMPLGIHKQVEEELVSISFSQ